MNLNKEALDGEIKKKAEEIEGIIKSYLPKAEGLQKTVIEAMNYSMLSGGKRLRPMLMQETYRMFGGSGRVVEPFMAALEMIHTYSLIHDDLPAMDNDEYRRGRKTTHVVYGEAMAILAGDALLNYAFETAVRAFDLEPGNTDMARALGILAGKAGIYGMIGGQVVDVESEHAGVEIDKKQLLFIHENKTGALIQSAMTIGALLAGATDVQVGMISQVALDIGLAFQIQDDILDVTGSMEKLGKPIGSDEKNGKATYVSLEGLTKAKEDVAVISGRAIEILDSLPVENAFLRDLILSLITREK